MKHGGTRFSETLRCDRSETFKSENTGTTFICVPDRLETMTNLPCEILRSGRNAFVTVRGPMALTSNIFLAVSVSVHSTKPTFIIPALLTTAHSATMENVINFGRRKHSFN
jgi:hypothetical protein